MKHHKTMIMKLLLAVTLLVSLSWSSFAQSGTPPEGIDFSVLTEESPQSALSLQSGYKATLETT